MKDVDGDNVHWSDSCDDDITQVIFVILGLNRDDDICVQDVDGVDGDNGRTLVKTANLIL